MSKNQRTVKIPKKRRQEEKLSLPLHTENHINMDTLISFAKENFQLITLFVGVIGVFVSAWAVYYEIKKKRKQKDKQEEEKKQ